MKTKLLTVLFLFGFSFSIHAEHEPINSVEIDSLNRFQTDSVQPRPFGENILFNVWDHPAYAGVDGKHNFNFLFQNFSFDASNYKYGLSYSGAVGKKKSVGLGASIVGQDEGHFYNTTFSPYLAIKIKINTSAAIRLGYNIGINFSGINDIGDLYFSDMIHERNGFIYSTQDQDAVEGNQQLVFFNNSLGLWFSNSRFFIGGSFMFPLSSYRPDKSKYPYPVYAYLYERPSMLGTKAKIYSGIINTGYYFDFGNGSLNPSIRAELSTDLNAVSLSPALFYTCKKKYMLGLGYRNLNTVTINGGVTLFNRLRVLASFGILQGWYNKSISPINYLENGYQYKY